MYPPDYDTGDHDTCPHNTFPGCNCYGSVVDQSDALPGCDEDEVVAGRDVLRVLRMMARDEDRESLGEPLTAEAKRKRSKGQMSAVCRHHGVIHGTPKALLFTFGENEVWLPRSEVEVLSDLRVLLPLWLMRANKLEQFRC